MDESRNTLATDLDGTLIPLDGNLKNINDLSRLKQSLAKKKIQLVFVTGRHLDSVRSAIAHHRLPTPDWVICDVGTSIYQCTADCRFEEVEGYAQTLEQILAGKQLQELERQLSSLTGLRKQESFKQGPFKLSYYSDANELSNLVKQIGNRIDHQQIPVELITSVDPFNRDGLIDLLPLGVSKAFALDWWVESTNQLAGSVVFAGDSGNDLAALTAGYRSIVVGNASTELMEEVTNRHENLGSQERLFIAVEHATSGVFEGCQHYGVI